jgi:hypothetical protein
MNSALRPGAWYLCLTCKSCSRPIPLAEAPAKGPLPAQGRPKVMTTRCPYPDCTARHDYVTTDLVRIQAEQPQ